MMRVRPEILAFAVAVGCGHDIEVGAAAPASIAAPAPAAASTPVVADARPARVGADVPFCAIGDLHGDLWATRAALRLCGAIDDADGWVGGTGTVVQVGDQLDRGPDERAVLELLFRLRAEARAAGGALHVLLGNHEIMNADGDLRYVTAAGFEQYADPADADPKAGRRRAFQAGGPVAKRLAEHPVVLQLGDTVFVHGGLTAAHVEAGIDALNAAARDYLTRGGALPSVLSGEDSPVWTRHLGGDEVPAAACADLSAALTRLGAHRLVIGHTVQERGIGAACGGQVWRVDAGISRHYGGRVSVLRADATGLTVVAP